MVAITVILAAVIGTFVLGLGDSVQDTSPSTTWDFDTGTEDIDGTASDTLDITHDGGDAVSGDNLRLAVSDAQGDTGDGSIDDVEFVLDDRGEFFSGEFSAGSSETLAGSADAWEDQDSPEDLDELDLSDATVRVVWDNGQQSSTLGTWSN